MSLIVHLSRYVWASILCSLGGFLFGMDTGIIGSVVVMQQFTQKFGSFSSIVHGLVVSAILIPAAFSSFFGGKLADWVGRPRAISLGALIFGVGAAIEAGAVHLAMFIVGRVVEGLGEGLYLGTLVVYICEISPPKQRGPLTTGPQLFVTVGLVVGFFTCYGCERLHSSMAWRTPFTLLAGVSVLFGLAAFLWLPESPRWLTLHNRSDEATRAWEYLQVSPADREELSEEDDYDVHEEAVTHPLAPTGSTLAPNTLEQTSLFDAFKPDVRTRTFLGLFLMSMQQLAGIDGVLYYAPLLFEQAGMTSDQASFLASGVSGIVIFAVTVPALIYADSWGRRHNVILGGLGLAATMLVIGALYAADAVYESTGAGRWVVIVAIYLFAAIYSVSWAVSCKIYAAEIQPQRTRASATCLAHGANWISNFFVALITPVLLAKSSCAAYFLFGGCTLVTAAVCWVWMPETKGKSLEEVERSFVGGKRG
ncbi:general substrate transporter [Aspergillus brunneoviolaceus CBS 621.78]|uniref:General substrate transporter n=1 Tax=Aspergillus brunneoviolaceus CBS 621.78 TaxID=1450534 RepID=A0ACD1GPU6_9EURO|nr:general substrate transporter [Aspergillus brunneoviolaceus CBS 621.78]RAH51276.1 general substrate transporter [Aspergillus brunneoviolaceus CBS 621.78]